MIEFAKQNNLSATDTAKDINILRYVTIVQIIIIIMLSRSSYFQPPFQKAKQLSLRGHRAACTFVLYIFNY